MDGGCTMSTYQSQTSTGQTVTRKRLNNANATQRQLMRQLNAAANDLPSPQDSEAYWQYQNEVMQPIRDAIIAARTEETA
jgi:hypothetical protein